MLCQFLNRPLAGPVVGKANIPNGGLRVGDAQGLVLICTVAAQPSPALPRWDANVQLPTYSHISAFSLFVMDREKAAETTEAGKILPPVRAWLRCSAGQGAVLAILAMLTPQHQRDSRRTSRQAVLRVAPGCSALPLTRLRASAGGDDRSGRKNGPFLAVEQRNAG
jgi:hypothetical protein